MADIKRIYPESKSGLINWIEQNFHDIDELIFMAHMKDETQINVYDNYSYRNALGMMEIAKDSLNDLARNDEFIPKVKD